MASRTASLGEVLAPGAAAFTIEGGSERRIDAVLPGALAATLQPGDRLVFRHPGGTGEAKVLGISSRAHGGGGGRMAVLSVLSGNPAPGLVVELVGRSNAGASLRVPLAAVLQGRGGTHSVLLVGADKRLRQSSIALQSVAGSHAIVTGKLGAGDLVVAAGGEFLEPGLLVRPTRAQR